MFTSNPFAEISGFLSPDFMQAYVVIMVVLVVGGTLYDIIHKKTAKYFFKNWQQQKNSGARQVGGGEVVALAVRTAVVDGLMSGEFCNARRRIAHLLTMTASSPTLLPQPFWCSAIQRLSHLHPPFGP